ncbi:hypothetical protein OJAV_G00024770 [Oryzias javanicus]|uniref:CCHC-type domain-containing protein n=1 Tax=Oryzias javanicus TaxID=123683 RepID=A0A437DIZ1_ORYJA|nr:hypothetical protein OJAV_G00024770 [Oryzias javanicus]
MAQLKNWCIGEGLDPVKALLVKDVPPDADVGFIEETLQTIKALGRVKVRGRMYDPQSQSLTVLCECREQVNTAAIPLDVMPEGSAVAWRIVGPSQQEEEPQSHAADDGQRDPQSDSSLQFPLQASTPEAIIRAVGDILQMTNKPANNDHNLYRRMRTFSGVIPTPAGEEQLENWVEQARLTIEESDRPEREKKMRIMESVKGPALEILQAVRFNNPAATSCDYIDILETTFGSPESGEELYFAFRMLSQHPNERLSEFLRRLERVLNKVVKKGGLQSSAADKARIDQLIKGAVRSDLMILNLRLRDRRASPPSFFELLNEIRLEEEHEASRRRLLPPKSAYVKTTNVIPDTENTELKDLKAEIHQLQAQVSELSIPTTKTSLPTASALPPVTPVAESSEEKNIKALKKEVVKLRKQVSVMSVKPKYCNAPEPCQQETQARPMQQRSRVSSGFFCYRCGEDGHYANKCVAPENYQKVAKKLLQAQRKPKQNQTSG